MRQTKDDIICGEIPGDILATASVVAAERIKHEYNRFGLPNDERISVIETGLVGELVFGRYLHRNGIPALYYMVIGDYDAGYDWRAGQLKIDVKTSTFASRGQDLSGCVDILYRRFHLYVANDRGQAQKEVADCYVQAFVIDRSYYLLSGYRLGVPKIAIENPRNVFPAMGTSVADLSPMQTLVELDAIHPLCSRCGARLTERQRRIERGGGRSSNATDTVEELMAASYRRFGVLLCLHCSLDQRKTDSSGSLP